jgi:serine/threonine-protein kinase RsbW
MTAEKPTNLCSFHRDKIVFRFQKTIPGCVESVEPLVDDVMDLVDEMKCAEGKEYEISLALREALANAIVHGCEQNPNKRVQICVGCEESQGILIVVRDPGPGFDPDAVPSPLVGEKIYASHGRGIFLMNSLMDEVHFDRGGTEVRMVKRPSSEDGEE